MRGTSSGDVFYRTVSDNYLRTMKMPLVAGRWSRRFDARLRDRTQLGEEISDFDRAMLAINRVMKRAQRSR